MVLESTMKDIDLLLDQCSPEQLLELFYKRIRQKTREQHHWLCLSDIFIDDTIKKEKPKKVITQKDVTELDDFMFGSIQEESVRTGDSLRFVPQAPYVFNIPRDCRE